MYNLSKNELISSQVVANVKQMFERILRLNFESLISLFHAKENIRKGSAIDLKKGTHSPLVEVKIDSCSINLKELIYIRKSTAVWLFQEGERVSSDHLLRVRSNQLFNSVTASHQDTEITLYDRLPDVNSKIKIGELCVFRCSARREWRIEKVQKFSKFKM